ncbi:hypothetical protein CY0110_14745 [Crocosphaera chwakensis CCY0110]|uniref:Uncharacterized protein n=2 Tax=Crocosphaera TaxID=263510 RepID=A3IZD9_9CHRO|nr:hypothetical protein CY0110_14745 [Crocosphaera chwakensis CCY0110]
MEYLKSNMGRPNQRTITINYIERNEATEIVEEYLSQMDSSLLRQEIMTLLFCQYLPVFSREIPRKLYEKELIKCLKAARGLLLNLEKELETTRNYLDSPSNWLKDKFKPITNQEISKQQSTRVDELIDESDPTLINNNDLTEDEEPPIIYEEEEEETDDLSSDTTQRILDNFPDYPV